MAALTEAQIFDCCACRALAAKLAAQLQADGATSLDAIITACRDIWWNQTSIAGWLEAFGAHPRIGDAAALSAKLGGFGQASRSEQAAASGAPEAVYQDLAQWNRQYEAKFGHVFLIYAAGKSADEVLAALQRSYARKPHEELVQAAAEQMRITERRLASLLGGAPDAPAASAPPAGAVSPVTSHVLDTALGRPAAGVLIGLQRAAEGSGGTAWDTIGEARTNADGRVSGLLPPGNYLAPGCYRVVFATEQYMATCRADHPGIWPAQPFYPTVSVVFNVAPDQMHQHFHIPLTWNPFGYSTYRGS